MKNNLPTYIKETRESRKIRLRGKRLQTKEVPSKRVYNRRCKDKSIRFYGEH